MLNDFLTDELKCRGYITKTNEYAWKYSDVKRIIDYLSNGEYAIMGGDVLNSNFEYTYDNWYYSYNNFLSLENNIDKSILETIEYIDLYNKKMGDDFYYILVVAKKADYLLMQNP